MSDWTKFPSLDEPSQGKFLLDVAYDAWSKQHGFDEIKQKVLKYLKLGYQVCSGRYENFPELLKFLDDPDMKNDFGAFFEQVQHDEMASAALDLASYACGFVARISAKEAGCRSLPEPVLESMPDIYEYYRDKTDLLRL